MTEDAAQNAVIAAPADASAVVIGAPGTGKTHALVSRVSALLGGHSLTPESLLVLTPSRQAATQLRDAIGVRTRQATPGPLARSLASFAFQVVRGAAVHAGVDEPPALLTGADQDRIIADMLEGDAADERDGEPSRWPEQLSPAMRASTGFRSELRAFLAECTELGVDAGGLAAFDDEIWRAVGNFLHDYRQVLAGMRAAHRDIPDLVSEAATLLRTADASALGPLAALRVVLIDDAQELTRGGIDLVAALRARGIAVYAFGDPDISSGAFRGATPQLFHELAALLGSVHVLDVPHRQAPALTALTRTVTQAIGAAGRVEHRRAPDPVPEDAATTVSTFVASSPYEEFDRIAGVLRDWHLSHGVEWSDMAVIAHDTRQVTALETELAAREVPTRAAGVQRPLGSEGVVRDIVGIVRLALTPAQERETDALTEALRTPFGGMDAVGLRRLRARLRHLELADGGATPAGELLRQAMMHPAHLDRIDAPEARAADRFAATLAEVSAAAAAGETIHELLWRVWDRARGLDGARLEKSWRTIAEQPGGGETARALDSLVALFDAAKRFVERSPEEEPSVFIHDILDSEVPEDTLSTPDRPGLVTLLTPATALGSEFDVVVVAGVQDGVWPNVRLRGGMLGAWRLADAVLAARTGTAAPSPGVLDRRRSALHDELRLFVRAVSRARSRLLITAVDDDDMTPSGFFAFLPPPVAPELHPSAEHPLTLRGLVARHRRALTTSTSPRVRNEAAAQLSILAREGVAGAHPDEWYGVAAASTSAPLHDLAVEAARVSPSRMESFEECELNWVISALGGDTVLPPSAGIGTIVHEAMEKVPDGELERMREILAQHWPELDFETAWIGRKERRRADQYIDRLHSYLTDVAAEGGRALASEVEFRFAVEIAEGDPHEIGDEGRPTPAVIALTDEAGSQPHRAVVHGFIDRVEAYPPGGGEHAKARGQKWDRMAPGAENGRVVVVDLKTGKYEPENELKVVDHAQLAAYQVAVQQGLVEGADPAALTGARLVLVAKTLSGSDYRVAHQHTLDAGGRNEFLNRIADAARGMSASSFTAQVEVHCADTRARVQPCRIHTVPAVSA
ncbi:superfamily I DNA/RNA helicase [Microbacterium sp. ZKA21]|uniref:ATP-dependent helicase n=1 Tax=Microbacterium sp. ZKA21 TaxID=3381694 RepID=UPI003D1B3F27